MNVGDIIGEIGNFFTSKEVFISSRVNKCWYNNLIRHKKIIIQKIKLDIQRAHCLNNICPCAIENVLADNKLRGLLIQNFKLLRYACSELNENETPPQWFSNL